MGKVKSYYADKAGNIAICNRYYPNRREDQDIDSSYRRGYHHGYSQAIDDIQMKIPIEPIKKVSMRLCKFFDNYLTPWRYGKKPYKQTSQMDFPPEMRAVKQRKIKCN